MRRALAFLCFLFAAIQAGATEPVLRGRLCFADDAAPLEPSERCVRTEGRHVGMEAAEATRRFAWFAADGAEIALGFLDPGVTKIDLRARDLVEVPTSLAGSDPSEWPVPVTIVVDSPDASHRLIVPARGAPSLRRLRLPRGSYQVELSAPRHHPVKKRLVVDGGGRGLGQLALRRYLRLSGRVLDALGMPLAGAEVVLLPANETFAMSAADGTFSGSVAHDWPSGVIVRAPGFGTRIVRIPVVESDTKMDDVKLSRGGEIKALLRGVAEATFSLVTGSFEPVTTRMATEGEPVLIADVAPGNYVLLAKGTEPFEKLAVPVRVEAAETTQTVVEVDPAVLELSVRQGAGAVAGASVQAKHVGMKWEDSVVTDDRGAATVFLWQRGEFAVLVTAPGANMPAFFTPTFTGDDRIEWTAELPDRKVAGVVVDERNSPIADATLTLETESDRGGGVQMRTRADIAGRFEFAFVEPGMQLLRASADDYLSEMRRFQLPDRAGVHTARMVLRKAAQARVIVVDSRGVPVSGCAVIHSLQSPPLRTDESGAVSIPLRPVETKIVYFLPRSGSFAAAAVTPPSRPDEAPIRVTIPPAEATIVVRTMTTAGDPVAHVGLAMRVGGFAIPPGVMESMATLQGLESMTGPNGLAVMRNLPAGVFEIWPYFSQKEAFDIFNGLRPEAPARFLARRGENSVTLTFAADGS